MRRRKLLIGNGRLQERSGGFTLSHHHPAPGHLEAIMTVALTVPCILEALMAILIVVVLVHAVAHLVVTAIVLLACKTHHKTEDYSERFVRTIVGCTDIIPQ